MPKHETYDVSVEVDDERLPEYDIKADIDEELGIPRVSCWIPSESGKILKVKCLDDRRPRSASQVEYKMDGTSIGSLILRADHGPFSVEKPFVTMQDVSAEGGRRRLMFANLELTDDDDAIYMHGNAALGEIYVRVSPVRVTSYGPTKHRQKKVDLSTGKIHERSKKAGAHNIGVGPVSTPIEPWVCTVEREGPPIATFVFRYRPLGHLQAQGIAPPPTPELVLPPAEPRGASPEVELKDDDGDGEDEERIRALQEKIDAIRKRKRAPGGRVKAEPSARRPRLSLPDEIIDLTSD